jgi:ferritin-like metal-binding protein YciE
MNAGRPRWRSDSIVLDELRDMYSAENQLVKALPKLAKGKNRWPATEA